MSDVDVYLDTNVAGRLTKKGRRYVFSYQFDADEALSLTMPLRTESYSVEQATAKRYGRSRTWIANTARPNTSRFFTGRGSHGKFT